MFPDLRFRLRALFRKRKVEAELDEELRFHLYREVEKQRQRGLPPEEAERHARIQLGGLAQVKDETRQTHGISGIEILAQDVRYACRGLRNKPGFTAVALLLLALGIGANTTVFTVASQVLLRSLPVQNPGALVQLKFDDLTNHVVGNEFSYPAFQVFSQPNALVSGIFARSEQIQVNVGFHGVSDFAHAVFESSEAASVLGITPALGRLLNPADAASSGETPPLILSYAYWQRHFGGDPAVIGTAVDIDTMPFVIAGVTSANFHGVEIGVDPDITLPAYTADAIRGLPTLHNRNSWGFAIICRVKPGVTPERLRAALTPAFSAILTDFVSNAPAAMGARMQQFASQLRFRVDSASLGAASGTRDQLRYPLGILMVITALVFLVTCANLAGLVLARTESRSRELGIRLAIGCSRGRLIRQLLTESGVIAIAGSAVGIVAAFWTGPLIPRVLGGNRLEESITVRPDTATLAYGLALAVVSSLLLSLSPTIRTLRLDPLLSIRRFDTSGFGDSTLARPLIVCQIAVSIVLALGAGQLVRSLQSYMDFDPGFRPDHLITVSVRPDLVKYSAARNIDYARQMYQRLSALPSVKSVTYSTGTIGQLSWNTLVTVPGYTPKATLDESVGRNIVGPRFVETLGLTLLAGRDFDMRDTARAPATVIVNESFARHFFNSTDVLGRPLSFIDSGTRRDVIVGVVRDALDRGLREPPTPVVYSAYEHDPLGWLTFSLRVQQDPKSMLKEVISVFHRTDPRVPIEQARTAEAQISKALERESVLAVLSSVLGALATIISMVGLYGLLAYSVARRTREIGIRIALGARPTQVCRLAVAESARILVYGAILGGTAYLLASKFLKTQIAHIKPEDPLVIGSVIVLLTVCAALSTCIPALRSVRINPVTALKCE